MISGNDICALNRATPYYIYDMDLLEATLAEAVRQATRYDFRLHYALKANNEPTILRTVSSAGIGADCVSGGELRWAQRYGFSPQETVLAGAAKTDAELRQAIVARIGCIHCESLTELSVIDALAANEGLTEVRVALRLNPTIDAHTHPGISTAQATSKFGISPDEALRAARWIDSLTHITVCGLHVHVGSQITDANVFEQLSQRVNEIVSEFDRTGFRTEYLNLGGGLGVNYADPQRDPIPDFESYFGCFARNLRRASNQTIHFELGRSLVAQCGNLITRVLYTKQCGAREYALVDAGMNDLIRPALYHARHAIENLSSEGTPHRYAVAGPVCESSDEFAGDVCLAECRRGDLLRIRSTGAYGSSMASRYNMRPRIASEYWRKNQ